MKRKFRLFGDIGFTGDLKLLILIGGLYSLSMAMSNTFVNIYLWKQSGKFSDLALYNFFVFILQPITFIFAGRWAKNVDRVILLRVGVFFLAIFYLVVLIAGTHASRYILLLGGLLGIGYGFYWLSFNLLTFEVTEPDTRDFFNGFLGTLTSIGGMIGPMSAGLIITHLEKFIGYSIVFGCSLALFSLAVFLSFFLKGRPAHGKYELKRILAERKQNENWRRITNAHFFQGLREGTFLFVISVLVFLSTDSELALGTFGLVNSFVSFIVYFAVSRFIKKEYRKKAILAGGIILYAAVFFIVSDVTYVKLLVYSSMIAIGYPILLIPYMSMTFDVIGGSWKAAEMRIEYIVVREIFLNGGRVISILLFLFAVTQFNERKSIPIILLVMGAGHTVIYWCIRKINIETV
ncbi:MAG: MFS transporter [Bacillota bacterium]|nr:MFS transporter [Bacillota bacterium]